MSSLFGKKPEAPKVTRMPLPEDDESRSAEERQRRAIASRTGRRSTIMSRGAGGEAGTRAGVNSLLGQAG